MVLRVWGFDRGRDGDEVWCEVGESQKIGGGIEQVPHLFRNKWN